MSKTDHKANTHVYHYTRSQCIGHTRRIILFRPSLLRNIKPYPFCFYDGATPGKTLNFRRPKRIKTKYIIISY